ncbi:uncharacterized protein [Acropora muricata]|uniref:uncharacterized protein n=1 Tax=Acropora muricata TaxID=159855 RepID=UPI0034E3F0FD
MDAPNNTRVKVPNNSATSANVESEDANEALSPNPVSGRDEADDHTNGRSKLVSCKQTLRVATLNVRTLNGVQRQSELVTNFNKQRIDLIGIQEHRIVHDQPIQYQSIQGRSLITSSAWKNVCGAAIGGVGILLGAKASSTDKRKITLRQNPRSELQRESCINSNNCLLANKYR